MSKQKKMDDPSSTVTEDTGTMDKYTDETFMIDRDVAHGLWAEPFFLVMNGVSMGQELPIAPGRSVIGREDAPLSLGYADIAVSRRHAEVVRTGNQVVIRDNQSKNGVIVNDQPVPAATLEHGHTILLGHTLLKFFDHHTSEIDELTKVLRSAVTDGLTGIYNKKAFLERLEAEFSRAHRHDEKLSLLMIDLDLFKLLNDRHGHLAGDCALIAVARSIERMLRKEDLLARFGGEEFVVIAPGIDYPGCRALAERVRQLIERTRIVFRGEHLPVTVSVGCATRAADDVNISMPDELINAADNRLYEAKQGGRNCCR